jgi:hypothetical protein
MSIIRRRPFGSSLSGILLASLLAGCQASAKPPFAEAPAQPPAAELRFTPGTTGLPRDGKWKSTPLLTDLNHDALPDIAAHLRLGHGARVWLGNGEGAWHDSSEGLEMPQTSCGGGIATGDLNRDGHPDLVVGDHCHGVFVLLGDGLGRWRVVAAAMNSAAAKEEARKQGDVNVFLGTEDLDLGDVNEDGFPDIVTAGSDRGGFTVYLNDGTGLAWTESGNDPSDGLPSADDPGPDGQQGGWAQDLLLKDMNGDGHLDVVASYFAGPRVWLGDGKGHWRSASEGLPQPLIGGIYQRLAVADIDGDGRPDLCVANEINGVEIFRQQPDGSWRAAPDPFPALRGGARAVAVGDIDGDRHPDIVVGGSLEQSPEATRGLFLLRGDGQGRWSAAGETGLPGSGMGEIYGIALGDVNGDGRPDIVATTNDSVAPARTGSAAAPTVPKGIQVWLNRAEPPRDGLVARER